MIIYCPMDRGWSHYADRLAVHYGCAKILDEWCIADPVPPNTLVHSPFKVPGAVHIDDALVEANIPVRHRSKATGAAYYLRAARQGQVVVKQPATPFASAQFA